MKKIAKFLLVAKLCASSSLFAASASKLNGFDKFNIDMPYSDLVASKAACDVPRDAPKFRDSVGQGVSSTVCPAAETFAMATLLHDKIAAVAVNWVSWDVKRLRESSQALSAITVELRRKYGIPTTTLPYESQFGNDEADILCRDVEYTCQMHIWKSQSPARVANLVFAKNSKGEIPLLFNISDLEAEAKIELIKNRGLQAAETAKKNASKPTH